MKTSSSSLLNDWQSLVFVLFLFLLYLYRERICLFIGVDYEVYSAIIFFLWYIILTAPNYIYSKFFFPKKYSSNQFHLKPSEFESEAQVNSITRVVVYVILGGFMLGSFLEFAITFNKFYLASGMVFLFLILYSLYFSMQTNSDEPISRINQVSEIWMMSEKLVIHLLGGKIYEFEKAEIKRIEQLEDEIKIEYQNGEGIKSQSFYTEMFLNEELSPLFAN